MAEEVETPAKSPRRKAPASSNGAVKRTLLLQKSTRRYLVYDSGEAPQPEVIVYVNRSDAQKLGDPTSVKVTVSA